ncbi:MAG: methylmalonyl-CoA epimerase [Deltaproteobacteria bacterium]
MKKIEHIGIAVKDLEQSEALFTRLLNKLPYKRETVEAEGVVTSFFEIGDSKIELLTPTDENSPIAKFLSKNKEGIHHIAIEVFNIYSEIERLRAEGFEILNETPKKGADNKLICFLHPRSTNGVLVEICQEL